MTTGMQDKVVVITGAGAGIGRACALSFAEAGARVAAADITNDSGYETAKMVEGRGGHAIFVEVDVADDHSVRDLIDATVKEFGGLDYAVNNAGIEGQSADTADCTKDNWDRVIAINLKGVWNCMRHEIPRMLERGGGAIVNMASVAGLVGFTGLPAYCASKGGVIQLTKTAALEYATRGIRVNAICPGVIHTAMVERLIGGDREKEKAFTALEPVGRLGRPEEIARAAVWLCSDDASFVTGHPLAADGGFVAR